MGRGFAVVADEIGKLADRSIEQAKHIQKIISETTADIESETRLVSGSSGIILEIEKWVKDVEGAILSIIELCEAQERMTRGIMENMEAAEKGSGDISNATDEQRSFIMTVSRSAERLKTIMEECSKTPIACRLTGTDSRPDSGHEGAGRKRLIVTRQPHSINRPCNHEKLLTHGRTIIF